MKRVLYSLMLGILLSLIIDSQVLAVEKKALYLVTKDGTGDFITIQEAVDFADDGSTIIIYPGVYEEYIEIYDKAISLIGIDRDSCIIQAESSHYYEAPIEIGAGLIQNLTIYGYLEGYKVGELQETNDIGLEADPTISHTDYYSYAIHIDQDYTYNRKLTIDNCNIYSDTNQCIGIGTRGNCNIVISGCQLKARGAGGCIFLHNYPGKKFNGNSTFILKDVILKNYRNPYVLTFASYGMSNTINLVFQNVKVNTVAYDTTSSYLPYNMNTYKSIQEQDVEQLAGNRNEVIHNFSTKNGLDFLHKIDSQESFIGKDFELKEGINIISLYDILAYINEPINFVENPACKKSVINIFNQSGVTGTGWCGLDGFTLRQDSVFNTLTEMNYITYHMEQ